MNYLTCPKCNYKHNVREHIYDAVSHINGRDDGFRNPLYCANCDHKFDIPEQYHIEINDELLMIR